MRTLRLAALAALAALCATGACQCQLLGAPIRCNPDTDLKIKACPDDQFCAPDGLCAPRQELDACAPIPSAAQRALHVGVDGSPGVHAADDVIAGDVAPFLVADAHLCNSGGRACPGGIGSGAADAGAAQAAARDNNDAGAQPLGALGGGETAGLSTKLNNEKLVFAADDGVAYDDGGGFTLEAIFKAPPTPPASDEPIVTMLAGADGWGIFEEPSGDVVLVAGPARTALVAARQDATWHHALCTVDTAALAGAAKDAVLCAVDGEIAGPASYPAADAGRTLTTPHDLVFGGTVDAESLRGAEAVIARVWLRGDPFGESSTLARVDAVVDEERARLMRYLGVGIDVDGGAPLRFLDTNAGDAVRTQPVASEAAASRFELVPGGWPRVAHTSVAGANRKIGLLLEPARENRLAASVRQCSGAGAAPATRPSPDGRTDACDYGVVVKQLEDTRLEQAFDVRGVPDFAPGTPFTFSAFLFVGSSRDPSQVEIAVEGTHLQIPPDGNCTAVHTDVVHAQLKSGSDTDCELVALDGDWVRVVDHFVAFETTVTVHLKAQGTLWSPQLEIGRAPTTPMARDERRAADRIVVDGAGLADATSTALRAEVVTDGPLLSMQPLFVSADASSDDHIASLALTPGPGGTAPQLVVVEQARQEVSLGAFTSSAGKLARIGADIGPPIDACDRCELGPLSATLPAAEQWQQVGFQGGGEAGILVSADVKTSGTEPLPLALDVTAAAPQSGCLDGARPDIAFVACAQGACPEESAVRWSGPAEPDVEDGPSVDELAVAGAWTAALESERALDDNELYLEVRFAPSGAAGDVVALREDERDAEPFLRIAVESDGAIVVADTVHAVPLAGAVAHAGEWTQLSCWLGLQSRCVVNAGEPEDAGGVVFSQAALRVVTVGQAAAATSFARLWVVDAQRPKVEIARSVGARVASSFGFATQGRRAGFDIVEQRAEPTALLRHGTTFTVGPHWPRIVEELGGRGSPGGIAYLADPGEGLLVTTRDLSDSQRLTLRLVFNETPAGDLITLTNAGETLQLVRVGGDLQVHHSGPVGTLPSSTTLIGVGDGGVSFGARHALLALERDKARPDLAVSAPLSVSPMTQAIVQSSGAPLRLRHLRIGTR